MCLFQIRFGEGGAHPRSQETTIVRLLGERENTKSFHGNSLGKGSKYILSNTSLLLIISSCVNTASRRTLRLLLTQKDEGWRREGATAGEGERRQPYGTSRPGSQSDLGKAYTMSGSKEVHPRCVWCGEVRENSRFLGTSEVHSEGAPARLPPVQKNKQRSSCWDSRDHHAPDSGKGT